MPDLVISIFKLENEKGLIVPSISLKYVEKDSNIEWTINCGGTRVYFMRFGVGLLKNIDDQAADSHFMANRITTTLFMSGCGLFRANAMGRILIENIPISTANITTHLDLWKQSPKKDDKENKEENKIILKEFSNWYAFICQNMLFRRAVEDAYYALLSPLEVDFYLYRGMEWLLKAADIGWEDLAKDIGVSVKAIKAFKKSVNVDLGQRHGIASGKKRRAIAEEYGSLIADYLYGLCNVRKRVDKSFSGITPKRAADIVFKAMPFVPYP